MCDDFAPACHKTAEMENLPFALNAQHSGAINHLHSFQFHSSIVDVVREVRLAVTVVVVGWIAITTIRAVQGSFGRERGG